MVRGERIKVYKFGTMTANADGIAVGSTTHPINGEIIKFVYDKNNFATNGSVYLQVQTPVVENIGSVVGNLNTDATVYPMKATWGTAVPVVVDDHIVVSGAGLGNGSSAADIKIYYR